MKVKRGLKRSGSQGAHLQQPERDAFCNSHPAFSFRFLTSNNRYSLGALDAAELRSLLDRLYDLSQQTWPALYAGRNKKIGLEYLEKSEVPFLKGIVLDDSDLCNWNKVIVFQFGHHNGRIFCVKKKACNILFLLGVDTKYRAYDHG